MKSGGIKHGGFQPCAHCTCKYNLIIGFLKDIACPVGKLGQGPEERNYLHLP